MEPARASSPRADLTWEEEEEEEEAEFFITKNDSKRHATYPVGWTPQVCHHMQGKPRWLPLTHGASPIDAHDTPTQPSSAFMLGPTLSGSTGNPRRLAFVSLPRRNSRWYPGTHSVRVHVEGAVYTGGRRWWVKTHRGTAAEDGEEPGRAHRTALGREPRPRRRRGIERE